MRPVDDYFLNQKEPYQSIMLCVKSIILITLPQVEERYSYKIPFYNMDKKPMLYLNVLKGKNYVDVAFVQGILLEKQFPILKNDNKRKQVRSIQLKNIEDLDHNHFIELLLEASRLLSKSKKVWANIA
ncbi:MAG: DUF1801 domain-containing protein [Flavobacteriales bacterium]|nr:DUF1801 domain-containing protein [Flavobacteriia bacterium]NCP05416.1 DUF1801 domain-containing protein [Flavobacteriales bacterium]PIV94955.1 MAG: 2-dehydro-3-deoxyphosphooctonate aldolase [Flavobacteriaceae bacterium CG17_big_fil_post_rev_8_21_14_2_50_33_15]PIY11395.1 MAG: 2-dehydro-3-deoxyphosphooctonate aldolase [Flavobacteriaceae bacterium CG_4_10_14_3_um_filter_33_47]PJB19190.1 MAG: 2-dehydro-3-deoxyphosphooctonate aldolase [Flavobacteriaceae bacterium CG_4_9_14_3_um_filter_33_16]